MVGGIVETMPPTTGETEQARRRRARAQAGRLPQASTRGRGAGGDVTTARFVGVLAAAVSATALTVGSLSYLAWALAGCYLAAVPLPDTPICAASLWPTAWTPFTVFVATSLMASAGIVAAARAFVQQFGGALRHRRTFERKCVAAPPRLTRLLEGLSIDGVVCFDDDRPVACTIGLLHPRIYLSTALMSQLDDSALSAVLAHEAAHVEGRDPLVLGAIRVGHRLAVMWPLVRRLADRAWLDLEARADLRAIDYAGRDSFLSALYELLKVNSHADEGSAVGSIEGLLPSRVALLAGTYAPTPREPRDVRRTCASSVAITTSILVLLHAATRAGG